MRRSQAYNHISTKLPSSVASSRTKARVNGLVKTRKWRKAKKASNTFVFLLACTVILSIHLSISFDGLSCGPFQTPDFGQTVLPYAPRLIIYDAIAYRKLASIPYIQEAGTNLLQRRRRRNEGALLLHVDQQSENWHEIASEDAAITPYHLKGVPLTNYSTKERNFRKGRHASDCVSIHSWQTLSYPTCNAMHEVNMYECIIEKHNLSKRKKTDMKYLSRGGNRDVWKLSVATTGSSRSNCSKKLCSSHETAVMKTLRIPKKQFDPRNYENQRRDAMAMERLVSSPHVIDIYSFCGQSVMTEIATATLSALVRKNPLSSVQRLRLARDAAHGLRDSHSIDSESFSTLIHGDVKDKNFVVAADGRSLKLNDFNFAQFLTWDITTNSTCGRRKKICGPYRSPEECKELTITEKADVYALGNIIYFILTGRRPYSYPTRINKKEVNETIIAGEIPVLPPSLSDSSNPAVVSMVKATKKCLSYNPDDRPSAHEIVQELELALNELILPPHH